MRRIQANRNGLTHKMRSVHYASTPTLNSAGNSSVEGDYSDHSSDNSSDQQNNYAHGMIMLQNGQFQNSPYQPGQFPNGQFRSPDSTPERPYHPRYQPQRRLTNNSVSSTNSSASSSSRLSMPPTTDCLTRIQIRNPQSPPQRPLSAVSTPAVNRVRGGQIPPATSTPMMGQQEFVFQESAAKEELANPLSVTKSDIQAIDTSYRGHKTRVFICSSLANLYSTPRASTKSALSTAEWSLMYTGIPVLLLDTGNTKSRGKRQIQILLVEKGTCFTLWKDVVDNLTKYMVDDDMFHTMHLSYDHSCRVGLSFDSVQSAREFHSYLMLLTSDPANIRLSGPNSKKSGKMSESSDRPKKYKRPLKTEISLPCGFQHVVSVDSKDCDKYFSLQAYVQRFTGRWQNGKPTSVSCNDISQ